MDDDNVSNHDDESANIDDEPETVSVDIYNLTNWGTLDNKARDILVERVLSEKKISLFL
jgi:hypothetical protein